MSVLPGRVRVVEVGPRDGFQMEREPIPTDLKVRTIEALTGAGLREIEVASFVHPRVIPQMRDAAEVLARIGRREDVRYWALVPNLEGAQRALEAGVGGVHGVVCVTETYNRRNVGLSVAESVDQLVRIVRLVDRSVPVAVTMAATFGCPFEGQLTDEQLLGVAEALVGAGIDELGLADTVGLGHPPLVRRVVGRMRERWPELPLRMHLHDTRGLGLANAIAALEEGVDAFDTAFGGLGGCPMIRGASGNLATEDFVHLCAEVGVETGVDLKGVRRVSRELERFLDRRLPAKMLACGTREELYAANRAE